MSKHIRIPALAKIAATLEAQMDACRPEGGSDATMLSIAWYELADAVHDALDALGTIGGRSSLEDMADAEAAVRMDAMMGELAATLPPVRGGAPDDFEELDPAFASDPDGWPAFPDLECDGYAWEPTFDGPTPLEVLALDQPTWEPSAGDWLDYLASDGSPLSEADHAVLHGCC